ncbi:MAG: COQ9 family protein [Geminicoccaceae bacterium]|nr:COQ9 family protein [Geminicoccaceae bacterium]MDW8369965.1 COQ9 family protein [Geminicoccaceae bacterium]
MTSEALRARQEQRDRILEAALAHAAFDGWSTRTLLAAADDAGIDRATARRLFPQGGDSLLAWLDDWADRRMLEACPAEELARLPIRRRIARLVRARLEPLTPHREAVRRALAARGLPGNLIDAGKGFWTTLDRIWQATGLPPEADAGLDFYTRRLTLAGVLASTTLFWLDDESEDCAASWAFLDRRIEDALKVGRLAGRALDLAARVPGLGGLRRPARA